MTSFVYFARRGDLIKIGSSYWPSYRVDFLKASMEFAFIDFRTGGSVYGEARCYERAFHLHFDSKRIKGEWFELSSSDLKEARTLHLQEYRWIATQAPRRVFCECHPVHIEKNKYIEGPFPSILGYATPKPC